MQPLSTSLRCSVETELCTQAARFHCAWGRTVLGCSRHVDSSKTTRLVIRSIWKRTLRWDVFTVSCSLSSVRVARAVHKCLAAAGYCLQVDTNLTVFVGVVATQAFTVRLHGDINCSKRLHARTRAAIELSARLGGGLARTMLHQHGKRNEINAVAVAL